MSHTHNRNSALEWTRMGSRSQSPYFVPKPTPGYSSAYDTEKTRRNVPSLSLERSVGRAEGRAHEEDEHHEAPKEAEAVYRYGITEEEIQKIKQLKKRRKFLNERDVYVKAEGKTKKVVCACNLQKSTGRDSPIYWQSKEHFEDAVEVEAPPLDNSKLPGFAISKAPRFRPEAVPTKEQVKAPTTIEKKPQQLAGTRSSIMLKHEVSTFGRSPSRPDPIPDNRSELSVNYEYLKGHLTRTVHLSRYAYRTAGEDEKPSSKYKQLFKRLQRPHVPLSNRLRLPKGMSTMSSVHKGDLPSILRHADNDRLRAVSALAFNNTPSQVSEILYANDAEQLTE